MKDIILKTQKKANDADVDSFKDKYVIYVIYVIIASNDSPRALEKPIVPQTTVKAP